MSERKIYIGEAAELLNRREATIRGWERTGILPQALRSSRDHKQWRFWTHEKIVGIRLWIQQEDRRPGKGLSHYKPNLEKVEAHIAKTRGPRK